MSKPEKTNALAELKRQLPQLSPKKQLDALLSQTNARAAVRSVPAEQLYAAIADVGLADSTEAVGLAHNVVHRGVEDVEKPLLIAQNRSN